VAAEYEDGRPGYAADVVALAIAELDLGPGSIVLDLGAGTGKLTASTR
jgi:precorrin-6B methylase 2